MLDPRSARTALACLVLTACSSPGAIPSGRSSATPPAVSEGASGASGSPLEGPPASQAAAKPPATVDDCKELARTATDDGTAAQAALPTGDAKSDRLAPMREFIKVKRPGFRCCFDIWAGKIPEARLYTKVNFEMELDPAGKLKKASSKPEKDGPLVAQEVDSCLVEVAGTLTYPKSASGMDTTYTHRFDFKPRR